LKIPNETKEEGEETMTTHNKEREGEMMRREEGKVNAQDKLKEGGAEESLANHNKMRGEREEIEIRIRIGIGIGGRETLTRRYEDTGAS